MQLGEHEKIYRPSVGCWGRGGSIDGNAYGSNFLFSKCEYGTEVGRWEMFEIGFNHKCNDWVKFYIHLVKDHLSRFISLKLSIIGNKKENTDKTIKLGVLIFWFHEWFFVWSELLNWIFGILPHHTSIYSAILLFKMR